VSKYRPRYQADISLATSHALVLFRGTVIHRELELGSLQMAFPELGLEKAVQFFLHRRITVCINVYTSFMNCGSSLVTQVLKILLHYIALVLYSPFRISFFTLLLLIEFLFAPLP
jgi:hypothetical protein